jgi:hypothetical protein
MSIYIFYSSPHSGSINRDLRLTRRVYRTLSISQLSRLSKNTTKSPKSRIYVGRTVTGKCFFTGFTERYSYSDSCCSRHVSGFRIEREVDDGFVEPDDGTLALTVLLKEDDS